MSRKSAVRKIEMPITKECSENDYPANDHQQQTSNSLHARKCLMNVFPKSHNTKYLAPTVKKVTFPRHAITSSNISLMTGVQH